MLPYAKSPTVNHNFLLGLMAQLGMPHLMVDNLQSMIRKKPPTKPRTKKATAATEVVDDAKPAEAVPEQTEVGDAIEGI